MLSRGTVGTIFNAPPSELITSKAPEKEAECPTIRADMDNPLDKSYCLPLVTQRAEKTLVSGYAIGLSPMASGNGAGENRKASPHTPRVTRSLPFRPLPNRVQFATQAYLHQYPPMQAHRIGSVIRHHPFRPRPSLLPSDGR
jgi:hypothetical protein